MADAWPNLTAAQEILHAAVEIDREKESFSEWDLTVTVWRRNPNRFGCRGYEKHYPDHKRVMKEIMSSSSGNPIRRGWLERIGPNTYCVTNVGRAEAQRQSRRSDDVGKSTASPQSIYDAVAPLYQSPVFRKHLRDQEEPRLWLGAASFLQLARADRQHLDDKLVNARASIEGALEWLDHHHRDKITRGVTGGGEAIHRDSLTRLKSFLDLLETRFANQIQAIRATAS
jgi:hypothetical protein